MIKQEIVELISSIKISDLGTVHIVCGKTDMRQGIDSNENEVRTLTNEQIDWLMKCFSIESKIITV